MPRWAVTGRADADAALPQAAAGSGREPARSRSRGGVGWALAVSAFAAAAVSAVLQVTRPGPAAVTVQAVLGGVFVVAMVVGPVVRRVRPWRVWFGAPLGAAGFLVGLVGLVVPVKIGPLGVMDICYFGGYGLLMLWLVLLSRHVGVSSDRATYLDSASVATGLVLALWSTALAPLLQGDTFSNALVQLVYPTVDVTFLVLAVHLALRLGRLPVSLRWFVATMALQTLLDVTFAINFAHGNPTRPLLDAAYLFTYLGLAVAASHPSVGEMSHRPLRTPGEGWAGAPALIVFTLSPAVLSSALPFHGPLDIAIRCLLVVTLLALLFLRLTRTMRALSSAEAESRHRATHDVLTGLLNRGALLDVLDAALSRDAANGRSTAVLFFDCDNFKHINDTWGHHVGDALLRDIADRLPTRLRPHDILARHGGDEFVVVATVTYPDDAMALAARILQFFAESPHDRPDSAGALTPSIGVAVTAPGQGGDTDDVLSRADAAMYEAKSLGRNRSVLYGDDLAVRSRTQAQMQERLGVAVRAEALHIEIQPVVYGGGDHYDRLVGWEALARWDDPVLGPVPPDVFIPLAERFGHIGELGRVVLRRACTELAALRAARPGENLRMSVNVSPVQLRQPGFAATVADALRDAGVPPDALWLEITENHLIEPDGHVNATLHELRRLGVGVCIDDFGTGYASLSTLLQVPVDVVKLDRSLVGRLVGTDSGARQFKAVLDLLRSLDITWVVAEGVETAEHAHALRRLGCPMAQGWYLGRPTTTAAVLAAHPAPHDVTT